MTRLACVAVGLIFVIAAVPRSSFTQDEADQLVSQLREFRAALPAGGRLDATEERRRELYAKLRELGDRALPALARGLRDPDVQLRRNVALFLDASAGGWVDSWRRKMTIESVLPALIVSLEDQDGRVRELSAQAIGEIGPNAAAAVPALVTLLANVEEGSRNSACIGLTGIGPSATNALPALRNALSDSSEAVRRFARRAIDRIEARH
jgi:HEAT repeat protein